MRKTLYFIIIIWVAARPSYAQIISGGKVFIKNDEGKPIAVPFASVILKSNPSNRTLTDSLGNYLLPLSFNFPDSIQVNALGYSPTTKCINNEKDLIIELERSIALNSVKIDGGEATSTMNIIGTTGIENLGKGELLKAACCNLAESFSTNASVDMVLNDAASGTKKIQLLGLAGYYTQLTIEGVPAFRGIQSSFAMGLIPGPWINSIQLSKGAGTVGTGYDALVGQINVEIKKPSEPEKLYLNFYAGDRGRLEGNLYTTQQMKKGWGGVTLLHADGTLRDNDHNQDGFKDVPTGHQLSGVQRFFYHSGKRIEAQFTLKGFFDKRLGGTSQAHHELNTPLKMEVINSGLDVTTKTGFLFPEKPWKNIGVISHWKTAYHHFSNDLKILSARQHTAYANFIYQGIIANALHGIKTGVSFNLDNFQQQYSLLSIPNRTEIVPGVFGEYAFNEGGTLSAIVGLRGDYHNLLGFQLSPRAHIKWNSSEFSAIRLSGGRGFRYANPFYEFPVISNNRTIFVSGTPAMEASWNYGISYNAEFSIFGLDGSIIADYFRTDFTRRVVADYDINPTQLVIYNTVNQSYANAAHAELYLELIENLSIKVAYRLTDSKLFLAGKLQEQPFTPLHRGLINAAYETNSEKWKFDITAQFVGSMRIPSTLLNPLEYQLPERSKPYVLLNAQITRVMKKWEVYVGGENITNFKLPNVIISPRNPFSPYFDSSMQFAPAMGLNLYVGMRFVLNK